MIPAEDIPHVPTCGCHACHPVQPALWSVYGALLDLDEELGLRVMKEDGDESLYSDPFIALELKIAALLASVYGVRALQAKRILEEALTLPLNEREVREALDEVGELLSDVMDNETERELSELVNRVIIRGALVAEGVDPASFNDDDPEPEAPFRPPTIPYANEEEESNSLLMAGILAGAALALSHRIVVGKGTILEGTASASQIHEGIVRAARYYTNNHFNRIILPEIMARTDRILAGADPATIPGFDDINRYLSRRLQNVPYWRIVANSAASRAYHYGVMKAGALRQYRGYEIVAVIDNRTSDICLAMNGKQFWLNDTVDLLEKAVMTEDPAEFQRIMPWVQSAAEVADSSADELRDQGYVVPPFHPNCRSTIRFI